jgi:hypothetical protein
MVRIPSTQNCNCKGQCLSTNPSGSEKRVKTYKMVRREQLRIWKYLYNKVLHENTLRSIV